MVFEENVKLVPSDIANRARYDQIARGISEDCARQRGCPKAIAFHASGGAIASSATKLHHCERGVAKLVIASNVFCTETLTDRRFRFTSKADAAGTAVDRQSAVFVFVKSCASKRNM